jgi:hypothetical protein
MADTTFILNTGAKIPALGFGKLAKPTFAYFSSISYAHDNSNNDAS